MAGITYRSYNFVDKDPIIDYVRTIVNDSGREISYIAADSGVTSGTINNWLFGKTKRPQAATLNAVVRALGYKLELVPIDFKSVVKPTLGYDERKGNGGRR